MANTTAPLSILAFGATRDMVGGPTCTIYIEEGCTVARLREQLYTAYPDLRKLRSLLIAVNEEYGDEDLIVRPADEVALIPPVSGG